MLPPFNSVDFVDGHVELERGANEGGARRPRELEARIRRACGSNYKARVVVSAIDQADSTEAIRTTHAVAVSALVHCNSRSIGVAEDERLVGLVLKPESRVDKSVVGDDAGAKVGDGGGKVAGFVAKLLVAAHTGRGGAAGAGLLAAVGAGLAAEAGAGVAADEGAAVAAEGGAAAGTEPAGFAPAAGVGPELEHPAAATPTHKPKAASNASRGLPLVGLFILLSLCSGGAQ